MKSFFRALLATTILTATAFLTHTQATPPAAADTARLLLPASLITPVSLQSYESFRAAVQPLIQ
jgi:erythromycin esterase